MKISIERLLQLITPLVVLLLTLVLPMPSYAQAVISQIILTDVNYQQFPDAKITAQILDQTGLPIPTVDEDDLVVTENGQKTPYSIQKTVAGVKVAIVFDAGAGITAPGATRVPRIDEMKATALRFVQAMGAGDSAEIVLVRPGSVPQNVQSFTNDKNALSAQISNLNFPQTNAFSNGLAGVSQAMEDLKGSSDKKTPDFILLLSMGIQQTGDLSFSNIEGIAQDANITIYSVLFHHESDPHNLDRLAMNTGGKWTHYTSSASLDDTYAELEAHRSQYLISFRSKIGTSSQRNITVAANSGDPARPQALYTIAISPAPQKPQVEIQVNNNAPIIRKTNSRDADMTGIPLTEVIVQVSVAWPDGYQRNIEWAELVVDGQVQGARQISPTPPFSFTWDIRSYTQEGDKTADIYINLWDEVGLGDTYGPFQATVSLVITLITPCEDITGFEYYLCRAKDYLTIIPGAIALLLMIPTFILAGLAYRYRGQIGDAASSVFQAIGTIRLLGGGTKPRAYLHLQSGMTGSPRTEFKVFARTKIGRDPRYVGSQDDLLISNPMISALHCEIGEDDNGQFYIRDEGSSNGTFVNGQQIGTENTPLNEGDTIELAQVEHGGVIFKFSLQPRGQPLFVGDISDQSPTIENDDQTTQRTRSA